VNLSLQDNTKILLFENSHTLTNFLLKEFSEIGERAIKTSGIFNIALSGGRAPVEFYCRLSTVENFGFWQKTHIFWADERFVPFSSEDSNFRMIKSNLLDYIPIPEGNIHPVPTDEENVNLATEEYKNTLMRHFIDQGGRLPRFDFILLGMGEDGHTASLFPGDPNIDNPHLVTLPVSLAHLKHERVSMTLALINNASYVGILILGARKAEIAKKIMDDHFSCPAAKVNPSHGRLVYFLDRGAAAALSNRDME
jgi:6-phosphogluconolactonase